jgi:hypothetical protein
VIDAISFNSDSTQAPSLASVGSTRSANFTGGTDTAAELAENWAIVASSAATPGAGNGGANTQLVAGLAQPSFRFGANCDIVPGLVIDATTGVVSGSPNVPGGGLFNVVIERFTPAQTVSQTFTLLVADAAGNLTIAGGKSWTLNGDATLAGGLTVLGTLDTAGRTLSVPGVFANGGTVLNSAGTIAWLHRNGALPRGRVALIADAVNDLADDDGDGARNLVEFMLGMNPSVASLAGIPTVISDGGHLSLTCAILAGVSGVAPIVEVSSDLNAAWNSGVGFTETTGDTTVSGVRTLTVRSIATDAPLFIRLRAARVP